MTQTFQWLTLAISSSRTTLQCPFLRRKPAAWGALYGARGNNFLEKNDDSFAVKCAPPAAGFLHEEGHCQDVREEGNAGVSRWNAWFTSNHAAGISISHHFDTIIFSRKFLWHFFSQENSCSTYFLEKIHVPIFFSRKFL